MHKNKYKDKTPLSNPPPDIIKQTRLAVIRIINGFEQVYNMVGFTKVILNVVILGRDAEFDKLILECSALLKKAMHFTCYFHNYLTPPILPLAACCTRTLHPWYSMPP